VRVATDIDAREALISVEHVALASSDPARSRPSRAASTVASSVMTAMTLPPG